MRKLWAILLLPILLLLFPSVNAAKPSQITFTVNSGTATTISTQTSDGITVSVVNQTLTFTGGMVGSSIQILTITSTSTGQYTINGHGTFTGTVNGSELGSAKYVFAGSGNFSPYSQMGHVAFSRGTDGLSGLHEHGFYQESNPATVTITLALHFDPA